jgi:hypothetical protein
MTQIGGLAPGAIRRAATPVSAGWVAPLLDTEVLRRGSIAVRDAWARAGRQGSRRVITGRYFSLGTTADVTADEYIRHYYGADYFPLARLDTLTCAEQLAVGPGTAGIAAGGSR